MNLSLQIWHGILLWCKAIYEKCATSCVWSKYKFELLFELHQNYSVSLMLIVFDDNETICDWNECDHDDQPMMACIPIPPMWWVRGLLRFPCYDCYHMLNTIGAVKNILIESMQCFDFALASAMIYGQSNSICDGISLWGLIKYGHVCV